MSSGTRSFGDNSTPFLQQKTWSGGDTPYAKRMKGEFDINSYNMSNRLCRQTPKGPVKHIGLGTTTQYTIRQVFRPATSGSATYVPIAVHLADILGKWKQTDLSLGVSLAEGGESLSMVSDRLLSIASAARSIRKGDLGGALRHLGPVPRGKRKRAAMKLQRKDTSGAFLELHLGWEPLVKDIYEGCNIPDLKPIGRKIQSKRQLGTPASLTMTVPEGMGFTTVRENICQSRLVMHVENNPTFSQRFGLNNPYAIAWELVPFSFVVDYFLPIGDTISALEAISSIKRKWVLLKRFERYSISVNIPAGSKLSAKGWQFMYNARQDESYLNYSRSIPNLSLPNVVFGSAQVRLPSSVMRMATMAALAHQQLESLSPRRGRKFPTFTFSDYNFK